jgi:hypothetical protein
MAAPPDPAALAALAAHDRIRKTVDILLFFGNSIGTIFRATSTTNFNKTPSAKHILL